MMGEMADYYKQQDLGYLTSSFYDQPEAEFVWVAKDGTRHRPTEMTTRHLKNCVRMLLRRAQDACFVVAMFDDELKKRGSQ
jgi:hypothetical protein